MKFVPPVLKGNVEIVNGAGVVTLYPLDAFYLGQERDDGGRFGNLFRQISPGQDQSGNFRGNNGAQFLALPVMVIRLDADGDASAGDENKNDGRKPVRVARLFALLPDHHYDCEQTE